MAYREDKYEIGDSVVWIDPYYENFSAFRKWYGDGPFIVNATETRHSTLWATMQHTQSINLEGIDTTFSGGHFKKIERVSKENETEFRAIAMTEIARRLELAKLALLQVDLDYDLRKGFISVDTMRDVTRALELLK